MVCVSCQKDIMPGSQFCYHCGAKQPAAAAAPGAAPAAPPPAAVPGRKRLMRSISDKKLGGVCAGFADYFDLDPMLVRIVWLLAFLCAGVGGLAYIVCWIVIPQAPPGYVSGAATS
ncbi:MAG TPA: PspC domain-containing protein [Methylomirabilota bacterium]|nr:PspC domain-containing protein [Methylomirabilota bacterium]